MKSQKMVSLFVSACLGTFLFANAYADDAMQAKKDGEVLAFIITVDKNEIELAKLAQTKQTTPAVKQYAEMLEKQHQENLDQAMKLSKDTNIAVVDDDAVVELQKAGAHGKETLTPMDGKDFDKAYIDAMVNGHTEVLKAIDDNLMKNASNPEVKKFVETTRPHIEDHLHQGEAIQKDMK